MARCSQGDFSLSLLHVTGQRWSIWVFLWSQRGDHNVPAQQQVKKKKKEILNNSSTVSVYFLNYIFKHLKRECLWSMRCPWRWRTPSSQATQTCWHAVICSHRPGAAKFGTLTYIIPLIKVAVVAAHEWNIVSSFSDAEYTQLCLFAHSWYIKLVGKKKTKQTTKHVKQ